MKSHKRLLTITLTMTGLVFGWAASAQDVKLMPKEAISFEARPGAQGLAQAAIHGNLQKAGLYAVQVKFAPGAKAPVHTHPDERVLNVLAGVLYFGTGSTFDESAMKPLQAGSVVIIAPDQPHYVWAKDGEVVAQEAGFGPTATKPWPQAVR